LESATRRDLEDPSTAQRVATAVGDAGTLDLLAALTEADARATGPAAWTPWRRELLTRLVELVRARLERGEVPVPSPLDDWQVELAWSPHVQAGGIEVVVESASVPASAGAKATAPSGPAVAPSRTEAREGEDEPPDTRITVLAPDRVGLLAAVAGVLAAARLSVRSASVETLGRAGVSVWRTGGDPPDPALLRERVAAALEGRTDLTGRLAAADQAYAPRGETAPPRVRVIAGASATATVLEVRAHDRPG